MPAVVRIEIKATTVKITCITLPIDFALLFFIFVRIVSLIAMFESDIFSIASPYQAV
jgi:hypothetical protein